MTAEADSDCIVKQMMGSSTFLNNLLQFPKDMINEEMAELLLPYLNMEDFNLETAKKVCGNVAGLCSWTIAMYNFYGINKEVLPLKVNITHNRCSQQCRQPHFFWGGDKLLTLLCTPKC